MSLPYIPSRLANLDVWSANFSTLITATPANFGLTSGNASAIATAVGAFHTAYLASADKGSRTPADVATTKAAKATMLGVVRPFAQMIVKNASVSEAHKTEVGVRATAPIPSPVPVPATFPILSVPIAGPLTHTLRFTDSSTPGKRGKPVGYKGLQLFVTVGTSAATNPDAAPFQRFVSKQPYRVEFTSDQQGKLATYWARWQNAKGQVGSWSSALTIGIP